jgi:DNA-binding CsgD family transcriptional regulator
MNVHERSSPSIQNHGSQVTPREKEVLSNLCEGLSNKEIARKMDIVDITVRLHLRNIFRKIGAKNRAHAVSITLNSDKKALFCAQNDTNISEKIKTSAIDDFSAAAALASAAAEAAALAPYKISGEKKTFENLVETLELATIRAAARAVVSSNVAELALKLLAVKNFLKSFNETVNPPIGPKEPGSVRLENDLRSSTSEDVISEAEIAARAAEYAINAAEAAVRASDAASEAAAMAAQIAEYALQVSLRASELYQLSNSKIPPVDHVDSEK